MQELKNKFRDKTAIIGVVGLGYVGLPMAVEICNAGYQVEGIDINERCIEQLKEGNSYILDVDSTEIKKLVGTKLHVSNTYEAVEKCSAVLICVPTPLTESKEPDLSYINNSIEEICRFIKKETLVVLESTTYPGTTDELIVNKISNEKGWRIGEDFFVCFSPERVDPGNGRFGVKNTPKVVGGATEDCLAVGVELYQNFIDKVVPVSSTKVAELSKLLENTYRCINIAFVNEITMMSERLDINVWEAINAAATKPFGFTAFYPGPGVGGHCIPLDPLYLSWAAKRNNYFCRFIELASDINNNMPNYVVKQIMSIFANSSQPIRESKIMLVGVSYKDNISDLRESPSLIIYQLLEEMGIEVTFYDCCVDSFQYKGRKINREEFSAANLEEKDLVVILSNHKEVDYQFIKEHSKLIYDTKNVYENSKEKNIYHLGEKI